MPRRGSPSSKSDPTLPVARSPHLDVRMSVSWTVLPRTLDDYVLDTTGPIHKHAKYLRTQPPVDWAAHLQEGLIEEKQARFLTAYQLAATREERDQLLGYFQEDTLESLVSAVQKIPCVEDLCKFLVLLDDLFWEDRNRIRFFRPQETSPWKPMLGLLSSADPFVRNISSRIVAKMITKEAAKPSNEDREFFLEWLKGELSVENEYLLSVARCLQRLMMVDAYRIPFLHKGGLSKVVQLLADEELKSQAQYQLVYCLWVATFNPMVAEELSSPHPTLAVLVEVLESAKSEVLKIGRVVMATTRNLLEKPEELSVRRRNALLLIQHHMLKYTQVLLGRDTILEDPEYQDDIQVVESTLRDYIRDLSTFEKYRLEVVSRRLEWSIVHQCELFWRENADRLNENDCELVQILVSLLESSEEADVLCVAAHDLAQYMNRCRLGRKMVTRLGGKDALLLLLSHENSEVKYHALKTLQVLMLNSYDLLLGYVQDVSDSFEK